MNYFRKIYWVLLATPMFSCFAQNDFKQGSITLKNGDSKVGLIAYTNDTDFTQKCFFKNTNDQPAEEFSPKDLVNYYFSDGGRRFVSLPYNGKQMFFEQLVNGKLEVYYTRDEQGDRYYLKKAESPIQLLGYTEEYVLVKGQELKVKSIKHKGILKFYTSDAPQFNDRIDRIVKPDHKSLINLAVDYHNAVCDSYQSEVYSRKSSEVKVFIEPSIGLGQVTQWNGRHQATLSTLSLYFWMPRLNEKVYFNTGVSYFNSTSNPYLKLWRFPFYLNYMTSHKFFNPKFGGGISLRIPQKGFRIDSKGAMGLEAGFVLKFSDKLRASSTVLFEKTFRPAFSQIEQGSSKKGGEMLLGKVGLLYKI
ncbi:hypothetical protein SAMN06298216_1198 [Spirosomataceae bacterium TFI 002]|nr:hypothetical protein SAMN06298216_1198 [Spirosomataceae bacterium TFI 002]